MKTKLKKETEKNLISPHYSTHITGQVSPAGSGGEILLRVQPISVNHEVTVGQVSVREKDNLDVV